VDKILESLKKKQGRGRRMMNHNQSFSGFWFMVNVAVLISSSSFGCGLSYCCLWRLTLYSASLLPFSCFSQVIPIYNAL